MEDPNFFESDIILLGSICDVFSSHDQVLLLRNVLVIYLLNPE